MAEDHLAAPTPLEEHRKLAVFAGEWTGEEMVYPSRWTAGGPASSHVHARMDLNGFYLIQDTRQMRDGAETFATHGVFTYDRDDRHYKLFWHDSLGYYAPAPASGGWTGKTLILVRGSLRGNARHVYEVLDENPVFARHRRMGRRAHRRLQADQVTPRPQTFRESNPNHVHPDRQEHKSHLPGLYRQERHVSFRSGDRLWHQDGRRDLAGQRGLDASWFAGVRHRAGSEGKNRRRCIRHLRAAA